MDFTKADIEQMRHCFSALAKKQSYKFYSLISTT
ncbi:MAG: hypothetical protein JWP12_453 [Bacteroidetes bacterium]|nr:hypothetical protein [Bacteroidota bacterium]